MSRAMLLACHATSLKQRSRLPLICRSLVKDPRTTLGLLVYLSSIAIPFVWLVWDEKPLPQVAVLQGHQCWVQSVAFAPDGKTLVSAGGMHGQVGEAILWDVSTRTERMRLPNLPDLVSSVSYAPDGATLATAGYDKTVKLWDTATGEVRTTFRGENPLTAMAFAADGRLAASASFQEQA